MYYSLYYFPVYTNIQNYPNEDEKQCLAFREYPKPDTTILSKSVKEFQVLFEQGELLLNKLSDNKYSLELMEAAQHGNQSEVDRLVHSIHGLYVPINIKYTPSGAIFDLQSPAVSQGANCCTLTVTLKWGQQF